jgi:hypothetical protein
MMKKRGGYDYFQQGYQQQGYQPQGYNQRGYQQQGFFGNAINDLNNNKETLAPIYDTTASIGIIYNIFTTILVVVICSIMIYIGFWLKNMNSNKSHNVSGKYTNVKCTNEIVEDTNKNKKTIVNCTADVIYKVDEVEYKKSVQTSYSINDEQPVTVNYDPSNPDDFNTDNNYYYFGIGMIVIGILAIFISLFWLILSLIYKPVAAASGVGALGDAMM